MRYFGYGSWVCDFWFGLIWLGFPVAVICGFDFDLRLLMVEFSFW